MGEIVNIYNTPITLPNPPEDHLILNYGISEENQKWERIELPSFFDKIEYTKSGDLVLTKEQEEYAHEEVKRCKEGIWIFICGERVYIPKKYYFYLQWWILEEGARPEFRNTDLRYFIYLEYWEKVLWTLGIIRGKKRREGATSQACSNLIYECIFFKNSNCGLVSKTREDGETAFTGMVAYGYRQLPVFLKPKQVNKEDSVTQLIFAHKSETTKAGHADVIKTDEGHRSKINFKAPVLNAYDSGRMSRILLDEFGKLPKDVPASTFFSIVSKTLVKGVKRVGFVEMPSTVNSLTKGGGAEYKKLWVSANHFKKKPTNNRLVRYFTPAYDGYEGFIDEYGNSVIGEPNQRQYDYLVSRWVKRDENDELISELSEDDIKLGCKIYITVKRRDGLVGDELEEEIRQNPCDEEEMFSSANADCTFHAPSITAQLKRLEDNPVALRTVAFYRKEDQSVSWVDDKNGFWEILKFPPIGQENIYKIQDGRRKPGRINDGVISLDSYSNSQGGRKYGSKAGAYIIQKLDLTDPENTGMPIGEFYGRPAEKGILHNQIMLAAEFYGYEASIEHVADDYLSYFRDRGKVGYLMRYPKSAIDPIKRGEAERHYGYPTTPFALTKALDAGISYVLHYCYKIYFTNLLLQMLPFDPNDRTKSDLVVAFINGIVCATETTVKSEPLPKPLVKTYANPDYKKKMPNFQSGL